MPPSKQRHAGSAHPGGAHGPTRGRENKEADTILGRAVLRLEEIVDQETTALRSRTPVDFNAFNTRKSQGLLELSRALRMLGNATPSENTKAALRRLREKLDLNREVLQTHVEAVREVASIIAEAIRNAESDGTYSFSFRSKGDKP